MSLLIAMLMPALGKARLSARESQCAANMRQATVAFVAFANDSAQYFPDFSLDPRTGKQAPDPPYWFRGYWRNRMQQYGLGRDMWYSPSNHRWNRDDFYIWANGDPNTAELVAGYFYFGSTLTSSAGFTAALTNPPASGLKPFPRRNGDLADTDILWTDLNRQLGNHIGVWLTPGDPNRWGSNHFYGNGDQIPDGSHTAHIDNHVDWTPGRELHLQSTYSSVHMYW